MTKRILAAAILATMAIAGLTTAHDSASARGGHGEWPMSATR